MAQAQLPEDGSHAASGDLDAAFQALVLQHHALDEQLRQLAAQLYPTTDRQLTEVALKKHKLALKDRIAALRRERARRKASVSVAPIT